MAFPMLQELVDENVRILNRSASRYFNHKKPSPKVEDAHKVGDVFYDVLREAGWGRIKSKFASWTLAKKVNRESDNALAFVLPILPDKIFVYADRLPKDKDALEKILFHETVHTFQEPSDAQKLKYLEATVLDKEADVQECSKQLTEGGAEYLTKLHFGSNNIGSKIPGLDKVLEKLNDSQLTEQEAKKIRGFMMGLLGEAHAYVEGESFFARVHKDLGIAEVYDLAFTAGHDTKQRVSLEEMKTPSKYSTRRRKEESDQSRGLCKTEAEYVRNQLFEKVDPENKYAKELGDLFGMDEPFSTDYTPMQVITSKKKSKDDVAMLQKYGSFLMQKGIEEVDPDKQHAGEVIFALATSVGIISYDDPLMDRPNYQVVNDLYTIAQKPYVHKRVKEIIRTGLNVNGKARRALSEN